MREKQMIIDRKKHPYFAQATVAIPPSQDIGQRKILLQHLITTKNLDCQLEAKHMGSIVKHLRLKTPTTADITTAVSHNAFMTPHIHILEYL